MKKSVKIIIAVVVSICVVYSVLVVSGVFVKKEPATTKPVQFSTTDFKYDDNVALRIISCLDSNSNRCRIKIYAKNTTNNSNIKFPDVTDDKKMGDYTLVYENSLSHICETDNNINVSSDIVYKTSDGNVCLIAVGSTDYVFAEFNNKKYKCNSIKIKDEKGKEHSINIFKFTATEKEFDEDYKFCLVDKNNNKVFGF